MQRQPSAANTQFNYIEYLCSYSQTNIDRDWTDIGVSTYVLLKPKALPEVVNSKIRNIIPRHSNGNAKTEEFLYPFSRVNLYSQLENGKGVGGLITIVRTFSLIAVFILLIACINFMNLSSARSEKRAREVGIRKVTEGTEGYERGGAWRSSSDEVLALQRPACCFSLSENLF